MNTPKPAPIAPKPSGKQEAAPGRPAAASAGLQSGAGGRASSPQAQHDGGQASRQAAPVRPAQQPQRQAGAQGKPGSGAAAPKAAQQPGPANTGGQAGAAAAKGAAAGQGPARGAPKPPQPLPVVDLPDPATEAPLRPRHRVALASFVAVVVVPTLAVLAYLYLIAADQYHSEVAFSIRSEEQSAGAAAGLLGALTQMSTGTATDADILYEFITSQSMVKAVDERLDLRTLFRKPRFDPVFKLSENPSIEDLVDYWTRMVHVSYDKNSGIIHVQTEAFTPEDARAIAQAILEVSGKLVNELSEQARQDAIRYAMLDVQDAEKALREQRRKLAEFRSEYRIMNPEADVAGQMGLLSALQSELAQALVERDTLLSYVTEDDQRVQQANRRIDAISARIEAERTKLGIGGIDVAITDVIGRYEELRTDLEFAAQAYTQALANLTLARAEARRQARYLAPHIQPTLAEESLYPRRALLTFLSAVFLFLAWSISMVLYYNVRDSR
ncbi:capsular polysaccharide transport system permease protein [Albidovulum inexpectatum]|uniref:Capsular polysaccharide transport system permease protein n=1 Tax=Albidovulum inexpectatum TaxID=196587 RepID=A0A2S5JEY9_9RHOB|nr:hypothetical protein [Albidovulum inexpectatum]PPB79938.1 capsular polysaccharide transport system permease protein [Albidovulum inexpectatum]